MRLKNLQNGDVHLAKILDLKWDVSRTIWRIEVSEGLFLCIFHVLLFELNFFRPEFPFKLPVTFRREHSVSVSYHFFEIDKMKCLKTCSRNHATKGEISLLGNEDEPIFRGYVLPDQPELLVIFYKLFQLRQTHWIRNASFYWPYLGSLCQESIVMIIKHHAYKHCTFRLQINIHKLSSIFP